TLTSRITAKQGTFALDGLTGTIAGTPVRGRLEVALGMPIRIDGQLDADSVNVPSVLATAVGAVNQDETAFSSEPFGSGLFDAVRGRVRLGASPAVLTPGLAIGQAHADVRLGEAEIALEDIDGELAGGRLTGAATFRRIGDGVAMHGRLAL